MRQYAALILLGLTALGPTACAVTNVNEPSLARRPAEAIDPRLPIASDPIPGPADPALAARLEAYVAEGKAGAATFDAELGRAQALAAAAGPPQSDSWILAQQALSALEASRSRTTRASADIDELAAGRIQSGRLSAGDRAAIEAAAQELSAILQRQAQILDQIGARLAR